MTLDIFFSPFLSISLFSLSFLYLFLSLFCLLFSPFISFSLFFFLLLFLLFLLFQLFLFLLLLSKRTSGVSPVIFVFTKAYSQADQYISVFFMYSLLKWKVKNCPDLVVSAFERLTCYVFLYWEKQCWLHNTIRTFLLIIGDGMGWHSVDELHVLYCSIAESDKYLKKIIWGLYILVFGRIKHFTNVTIQSIQVHSNV